MKSVFIVVIEHKNPLPDLLPDALASRVYSLGVNQGQQVKVSVQEANSLEVREM